MNKKNRIEAMIAGDLQIQAIKVKQGKLGDWVEIQFAPISEGEALRFRSDPADLPDGEFWRACRALALELAIAAQVCEREQAVEELDAPGNPWARSASLRSAEFAADGMKRAEIAIPCRYSLEGMTQYLRLSIPYIAADKQDNELSAAIAKLIREAIAYLKAPAATQQLTLLEGGNVKASELLADGTVMIEAK